jgi:hypothetical protein
MLLGANTQPAVDNATRMFNRIVSNGDGKATKVEQEASRRTGEGEPRRGKGQR